MIAFEHQTEIEPQQDNEGIGHQTYSFTPIKAIADLENN
jgi:hypothetical protein